MIAIVKIGGHQAIVEAGDVIEVDKIDAKEGDKIELPVLMTSSEDGKDLNLGAPFLEKVFVKAVVESHGRGDKITVFKMKPRKRYRKTYGHRTHFTVLKIADIPGGTSAAAKPAKAKVEKTPTAAEPKAEAKKA